MKIDEEKYKGRTAGPWATWRSEQIRMTMLGSLDHTVAYLGDDDALINSGGTPEMVTANFELMADAPRLLERLIELEDGDAPKLASRIHSLENVLDAILAQAANSRARADSRGNAVEAAHFEIIRAAASAAAKA